MVDYRNPQFLGPALADAITGLYAAYGILGALVERGRTSRGNLVEVSMLEAMAHFAVEPFAAYFALGQTPTSADRPRLAQAYILRTADERLIAIHLSSLEKFWQGLILALEAPELAADARFCTRDGRIAGYEALRVELDTRFLRRPLAHWVDRLQEHDVPYAPINRIDDVVIDPQVRHLGIIVPVDTPHGGASAVRPAVQFGGARAHSVRAAPLLNEHGTAIRAALAGGQAWPSPMPVRHDRERAASDEGWFLGGPMLFPTTLVGSYPQPEWLIDRERLAGRFPPRVRARELWRVPAAVPRGSPG